MNVRRPKIPQSEQHHRMLDDLGAEPLAGSGFEDETPDPEFSTGGQDGAQTCNQPTRY